MPRFKKNPEGRGLWKETDMKEAVDQVMRDKLTTRQAALYFHVPKSTLNNRVTKLRKGEAVKLTPDMGYYKQTFSEEFENLLVETIQDADKRLMPFTKQEFCKLVFDLAEKFKIPHRFNKDKGEAGNEFYYSFIKRHPNISLRKPESTSLARAVGFNLPQVTLFYQKLQQLKEAHNFNPKNIYNADETGVSCVHNNATKVLSSKGKKQVGKLTSGERGRTVTLLFCANATGDTFIPPLFIFPRKNMNDRLKQNAPPGSIFEPNPSGWIIGAIFLKWLQHFVGIVKPTEKEPILLIMDGHASHKELDVITYSKENHVHLLTIPPHTSNKLQPLDRTFMKPFKTAYDTACSSWMRKNKFTRISDYDIAGLVDQAYSKTCSMDIVKNGFRCSGIEPFNPDVFTSTDFLPAMDLDIPDEMYESTFHVECEEKNYTPPPDIGANEVIGSDIGDNYDAILADLETPEKNKQASTSKSYESQIVTETLAVNEANYQHAYDAILADFETPEKNKQASTSKVHESQIVTKTLPLSEANFQHTRNFQHTKKIITSEAPSTSHEKTPLKEKFSKYVESLHPTGEALKRRLASRKRKSTKSEILTATPYKAELELKQKKKNDKENKKRASKEKKKKVKQEKRPNKINQNKIPGNSDNNEKNYKVNKVKKNLWNDENTVVRKKRNLRRTTFCGKCGAHYIKGEDWVQCTICKVWYHTYCVFNGDDLYFVCETCSSDISD